MMNKKLLIALLLLLILGGCFFNRNRQAGKPAEPQITYKTYASQKLGDFSWSVKYLANWTAAEQSTGKFKEFKDQVTFSNNAELITVTLLNGWEQKALSESYTIESQSQTQLNGNLGDRILGALKADQAADRVEFILAESGNYLLAIKTNHPGSQDFTDFLDNFSFVKIAAPAASQSKKVVLKLYFAANKFNNTDCEATTVKAVAIDRPDEDLALIPYVMKLLLQLSVPEDLSRENLASGIPINTRLYSYGYEDNKAIVNFSTELNSGGGSCLMSLRRSQIEKTLTALSEVSALRIKSVEIQVEGRSDTALQP
ncbi:MAG: GerMN domain-containing protein [Candidatus Komeilibacteria bacterium]|nr:GerMN domain-containing protein [Candidatus Komeilibacteria bacterium]